MEIIGNEKIIKRTNKEVKEYISKQIKNISQQEIEREYNKLIQLKKFINCKVMPNFSPYARVGNKIVDNFTFTQRLETKGKYNCSYFDFLRNIETFKQKKFIQNMIAYYKNVKNKNNKKNKFIVYKEIYNICISSINILRPLFCIEIYLKYKAKNVLNFCSGWGGTLVSACALNLNTYTGIDININLKMPYENMILFLKNNSKTEIDMYYEDAALFDYTTINYDFVLSSPPYYFLEKNENNISYSSKREMNEKFYIPLFKNSYRGLSPGGTFVINICKEVYDNVLKLLLGDANEIVPYKKSKKQNNYVEMVYIWFKAL
jgi:hypothetical protein